ncbi:MAG: porin family protein [Muribaculaceae bacterium]|nr:porin family protein [Muribaculaceae bacterium]
MKAIKRIPLVLLVALIMATVSAPAASAQFIPREKSVGIKAGYITTNESMAAGLFFQYSILSHLRIAPEIGCVFKHQGMDAFTIDLNLQVPLDFHDDKAALYPLAGLNYSSWNKNLPKPVEDIMDDVSTRESRLGLNLGAGFELHCSRTLKVGIEAKYTLIKHFSGANISALIGYSF